MAGKRIVIPNYMPALDINGDPVAGAKITFYENGTTDLKSIYTSAALNVAHPNPISANAAGVFASIFADEDEEFSVAITDADGNPISGLRNRDNVAPSLVYGQEAAESAADTVYIPAGTGAVNRSVRDKLRDTVSVLDFIPVAQHTAILAGTSTYDATADIQAAIDAARKVVFPGSTSKARYNATALTIKVNTILEGGGRRSTRLVQVAATASNFLTCEAGGGTGDITEGSFGLINMSVEPADTPFAGIEIGSTTLGSMFMMTGSTLKSQHHATLEELPYDSTSGSYGIRVNGGGGAFLGSIRDSIVQGFDIGLYLGNVANDWNASNVWWLDNRVGIYLADISIFRNQSTFESGVTNARGVVLAGTTSSYFDAWSRWELTQGGCYAVEFAGGYTGQNFRVEGGNFQINTDGSAIPGRKWTGTAPTNFVFEGYYSDGGTFRPFMVSGGKMIMPSDQQIGGSGLGNGKLNLQRNAGGNDGIIENDGTNLTLDCPNGVKIVQLQGGQGYTKPFFIGSYGFWVDGSGRLFMKAGYPANDTDGTVVGTQT